MKEIRKEESLKEGRKNFENNPCAIVQLLLNQSTKTFHIIRHFVWSHEKERIHRWKYNLLYFLSREMKRIKIKNWKN